MARSDSSSARSTSWRCRRANIFRPRKFARSYRRPPTPSSSTRTPMTTTSCHSREETTMTNKAPETSNIKTGTDYLREVVRVRRYQQHAIKSELNISMDALHGFAHGRTNLSVDKLKELALFITGGHGEYDATLDRMRPVNKAEPTPMGAHP